MSATISLRKPLESRKGSSWLDMRALSADSSPASCGVAAPNWSCMNCDGCLGFFLHAHCTSARVSSMLLRQNSLLRCAAMDDTRGGLLPAICGMQEVAGICRQGTLTRH